MLIEALYKYDDYLMANKADEMAPEGFTDQAVHFEILLDLNGKIQGIADLRKTEEIQIKKDKVKEKKVPVDERLPLRTQKSAICSNIIEHRPAYIFGLGIVDGKLSAEVPKAQKSHAAFVVCNKDFFENIDSDLCRAYYRFLTEWNPAEETENPNLIGMGKDFAVSNYCFGLSGNPGVKLHEDKAFLERYHEYLEQLEAEKSQPDKDDLAFCPIEGKVLPMARTHDKIKGLAGGQSSGCVLVGVNETAFESYGKTQSYNSSISETAMKKYTHSLNYLLKSKNHNVVFDELTVIFFAMKNDDSPECKQFRNCVDDSNELEMAQGDLNAVYSNAKCGIASDTDSFDYDVMFYVAGLTPNSSRISQKFVLRDKFGRIIENLKKHQEDMRICGTTREIYFSWIKKELIPPNANSQKVPPPLMTGIIKAALMGTKYPDSLLTTVIRRVKCDSDDSKSHFIKLNYVRAGLIKACINRKLNKEEIKMSYDPNNTNPAYCCGAIFAVLEKIQKDAYATEGGKGKEINSTIKDKFFASACSNPASVFPRLFKLASYHLKKLENPTYYNKCLDDLVGNMESEFPSQLSNVDQGRFIVGYYQMNQKLYTKKEDNE